VANPRRLVVSRRASVAVINILEFWAAVATAIYSRFSPVWRGRLIDGFLLGCRFVWRCHAFMHFDVGVRKQVFERTCWAGRPRRSRLSFLITAKRFAGFGALINQASHG
jgi:hypothetical protein